MVARAKGEIIATLPRSGFAILNGDDHLVMEQATRTVARVVTCGEGSHCDVRATDIRVDGQARAAFTLTIGEMSTPIRLQLHGRHFVSNALIAAGVAHSLEIDIETIAMALRAANPVSKWRMEVHQLSSGVTLINDAYNANPDSVRAAIDTLAAMAAGRRTWLILGEMRELGEAAEMEHAKIGEYAAQRGIDELLCVGEGARAAHQSTQETALVHSSWVADPQGAISALQGSLVSGDVALIKASRGIGLEVVASALLRAGTE